MSSNQETENQTQASSSSKDDINTTESNKKEVPEKNDVESSEKKGSLKDNEDDVTKEKGDRDEEEKEKNNKDEGMSADETATGKNIETKPLKDEKTYDFFSAIVKSSMKDHFVIVLEQLKAVQDSLNELQSLMKRNSEVTDSIEDTVKDEGTSSYNVMESKHSNLGNDDSVDTTNKVESEKENTENTHMTPDMKTSATEQANEVSKSPGTSEDTHQQERKQTAAEHYAKPNEQPAEMENKTTVECKPETHDDTKKTQELSEKLSDSESKSQENDPENSNTTDQRSKTPDSKSITQAENKVTTPEDSANTANENPNTPEDEQKAPENTSKTPEVKPQTPDENSETLENKPTTSDKSEAPQGDEIGADIETNETIAQPDDGKEPEQTPTGRVSTAPSPPQEPPGSSRSMRLQRRVKSRANSVTSQSSRKHSAQSTKHAPSTPVPSKSVTPKP